jgi:hypothetical protein
MALGAYRLAWRGGAPGVQVHSELQEPYICMPMSMYMDAGVYVIVSEQSAECLLVSPLASWAPGVLNACCFPPKPAGC